MLTSTGTSHFASHIRTIPRNAVDMPAVQMALQTRNQKRLEVLCQEVLLTTMEML